MKITYKKRKGSNMVQKALISLLFVSQALLWYKVYQHEVYIGILANAVRAILQYAGIGGGN